MRDDTAFKSQQFAEQVSESVEPAQQSLTQSLQHMSRQVGEGAQMRMQRAELQRRAQQEQQELELKNQMVASDLANDQIHRQVAAENLQWSRELHTTDILAAQKRAAVAQSNLAVAQAEDAQKRLQGSVPFTELDPVEIAMWQDLGMDVKLDSTGRSVVGDKPLPEDKRKSAGDLLRTRYGRNGYDRGAVVDKQEQGRNEREVLQSMDDEIAALDKRIESLRLRARSPLAKDAPAELANAEKQRAKMAADRDELRRSLMRGKDEDKNGYDDLLDAFLQPPGGQR